MKHIIEYIIESEETSTNKGRLEQLRKWLKGQNYKDYVKTLDKMLEDPKAKTLLEDGFGTELCNVKFKYEARTIAASKLRPTQNEIDIDKTLGKPLYNPSNIENDFKPQVIVQNMPLVTFNGKWIIDGHHRWSEVMAINPNGKLVCFDYSADISVEEMLKAVQGTIATVMAKNDKKLPTQKVKEGNNIFDMSEEDISQYVNQHITQEVCNLIVKQGIDDVESQEDAIYYIVENVMKMIKNNKPSSHATERDFMPQTTKAGKNIDDKMTAKPSDKGSALNLLARKTVDKETIE